MPIVDEFPFPAYKPNAIKLVETMAALYEPAEAILLTEPFGINPRSLPEKYSRTELWAELLLRLAKAGAVRRVVTITRSKFPNNKSVVTFLDELLAEKPVQIDLLPAARVGILLAPELGNNQVAIDHSAPGFWAVGAIMPSLILIGAVFLRVSSVDGWPTLGWMSFLIATFALGRFYYCSIDFSRKRISMKADDLAPAQEARTLAFAGVLLTIFSIAASGFVLRSISG